MRRKRIVQAGKCYHLVSRVAHKAFFFDDEEKDRFVDLLMRVEFFCCVKFLAYCCMSNHIHVFIFLEFGMFGSGKGKKAEREKEMQKAPSELAEKYPMPPKYELALEEGNGETAKRLLFWNVWGATRFLCRGNDIRQALARVFAPVGATTNLGRAANRAGAI